ncbi:MAG TPA: DNA topoisomerase IB [Actinomycetota bacterium]|jgi:DNA topoisomerase IB|nr:DNA topoisomerase IB [Actinomycetota bacterium]
MARIRRVDCSGPGIRRRRRGRSFSYEGPDGRPVTDPEALARIRALAIPPAWKDVWICPILSGHLQAVGTDAAGRRQYLYHEAWRTRRDAAKFDHMLEFAHALPGLRERAAEHLTQDGLTRERVLACATRLLDRGFFRMGTEGYAEQNQTYGLATIQKRHVRLDGDLITFDYVSKSGKRRLASVLDPAVREVVAQLKRRRGGPDLLAFKRGRAWTDVRSDDINEYIKEQTGGDFTAKDFRTWSATVLAAVAMASSFPQARSKTARARAISRAVQEVAHYLGNTPAVCRASYIDPRIFDRYRSGLTVAGALERLGEVTELGEPAHQGAIEEAVLDLIEEKRGLAPELDLIA